MNFFYLWGGHPKKDSVKGINCFTLSPQQMKWWVHIISTPLRISSCKDAYLIYVSKRSVQYQWAFERRVKLTQCRTYAGQIIEKSL